MNLSRRSTLAAAILAILFAGFALTPVGYSQQHQQKQGHFKHKKQNLSPEEQMQNRADTHVYLMRGLFGIFSLGMDDLAAKLKNAGYQAQIYQWDAWGQVVDAVNRNVAQGHRGPVVVIGHSLGANVVYDISNSLDKAQIPVLLGVLFDATEKREVPINIDTFLNFYARDGYGHIAIPGPGFRGEIDNYDLSADGNINHFNIDSIGRYHQMVLDKLAKLESR